jgi:hypothetical protein
VSESNSPNSRRRRIKDASVLVKDAVEKLRNMGLSDEQSRRLFEAELMEEVTSR